jgi:outer membrane protein assembly factor BamB
MAALRWLALLLTVCLGSRALAADWPQWRGPQRDGISQETGLLKSWPSEGPKLLWQVTDAGEGYSTPSVVGDRLYALGNRGMDDEFVQCRDVNDGRIVWSTHLGKVGPNEGPQYPGARSTPTVDGNLMFVLGSNGDLACLETATGTIRWQKNLRTEFQGSPGKWAYSESPLVDGDAVVCTPGGSNATMVALHKQTGDLLWKSAVPGNQRAAFASIVVSEAGGTRQYVQFLEEGVVGIDAQSGTFLWRYEQTAKGSPANIPTPLARQEFVYSAASRSGGGLVKLRPSKEAFDVEQVYFSPKLPKAIGGSVVIGGYLYGTTDAGLVCADFASGDIKWTERSTGAGSICFAEGNLYLHAEKGDVILAAASPDGYQEQGRFSPPGQPDRGKAMAWAYPVIANGRLYIRDQGVLWAYDIRR